MGVKRDRAIRSCCTRLLRDAGKMADWAAMVRDNKVRITDAVQVRAALVASSDACADLITSAATIAAAPHV